MDIGALQLAYQQIKAAREQERALKRLIGSNPDYLLIQSLINAARIDTVATYTFPNGSKLEITRKDAMDKLQGLLTAEQAASY